NGADLHGGQHKLVLVLPVIFFFPILDRLSDSSGSEDKFGCLPIHAHPRPNQPGVADLELQTGGLADNAHIGHYTMVHHVACAHTGAAISLAMESPDLRLFNLADDAGYDEVAFELNPCFLNRCHGFDITRKGSLHIDQPPAIDAVVFNHRLLRIIEVVHMSAEHESRAAP